MKAIITNNNWVYIDELLGSQEPLLVNHFSARHSKLRFIDTEQQAWDGWYRKFDQRNSRIARPLLNELKYLAAKNKLKFKVEDLREAEEDPPQKSNIDPDMLYGITMDDHQIEATIKTCEEEIGLIAVPTGGGKTEIMAAITMLHKQPTVIIADQRIIIEQIKERLELRDVVENGVGLFYGGQTPDGQTVVVGSIQSLAGPPTSLRKKNLQQWKTRNKNAKVFQEIVKQAGLLLVDEADKATDKRYRKLFLRYYKGRRKYGFSGTCFDAAKPVEALILKEHLGSIIYEVSRRELERIGRIIPIRAYMIAVGEDGDKQDRTAYDIAEKELIVTSDRYHQSLKKIIDAFPGDRNLVLIDTNSVEALGKALEEKIENSIFIYGKTSSKKRKEALAAFTEGKLKCLIGGKILKRGLDIKGGIHNLIICGGGKLHSDFNQKVGRAVRKNDRGYARMFCFFHLNNYYLYRHSREQLKSLLAMGYTTTVIVHGMKVDGEKLVKSRFRLPKKK